MISPTSQCTQATASVQGPIVAESSSAITASTNRHDPAEVRRLRAKLLKLILQDQLRREDQTQRGLPVRSVG